MVSKSKKKEIGKIITKPNGDRVFAMFKKEEKKLKVDNNVDNKVDNKMVPLPYKN